MAVHTLPYQYGSTEHPNTFTTNNNNTISAYWIASVLNADEYSATITFDIYLYSQSIAWVNQSSYYLQVDAVDELGIIADSVQIPAPHLLGGSYTKYSGTVTVPVLNNRIRFKPQLTSKVTSTSSLPKANEYANAMNIDDYLQVGSGVPTMYLGNKKVIDSYLGNKRVKAIYLGNRKVK